MRLGKEIREVLSSPRNSRVPATSRFSAVFKRGLIVSCQALPGEPLHGNAMMAAMARAAQSGGAVGVRANSPQQIRAIRRAVTLPIMGLYKIEVLGCDVCITPTFDAAKKVARAGADAIALDATDRPRPAGETLQHFIARIKREIRLPVVADVSTLREALAAQHYGADAVATTLSGYTSYTRERRLPDLALVRQLVRRLRIPVIAEGGYATPDQAARAIAAGAYAVVVGTAITRPHVITRRFAERIAAALRGS
jgi:N-acylglucosamine-6-phosphate 2-epimerase